MPWTAFWEFGGVFTQVAVTIELLRCKVSVDPATSICERPSLLADIALYSARG